LTERRTGLSMVACRPESGREQRRIGAAAAAGNFTKNAKPTTAPTSKKGTRWLSGAPARRQADSA